MLTTNAVGGCWNKCTIELHYTRVIQPGWLAFLWGRKASSCLHPSFHIFVPSSTDVVLYTGLNGGHSSNWKKVPLPLALLVVFSSVLLLIHRYDSFFSLAANGFFSLRLSSHFCPAEIVRSWGTHRKDCEEFASLFSMLSIVENRETVSMSLQSSVVVFGCVPVSSNKTEERISVKSTVLGSREQKIGHK